MKSALKSLIEDLEKIEEKHEEVGDTAVREAMYDVVSNGFVRQAPGFQLPAKFEMFSDEGNSLVAKALQKFLSHSEVKAAAQNLRSPQERLDAFQAEDIESKNGNTIDYFFGYSDTP